MKKITLELTETEFQSLIDSIDNHSSMIGGGDDDSEFQEIVNNLDKMLKRNGLKRKFK